jgi:hypothetical protein
VQDDGKIIYLGKWLDNMKQAQKMGDLTGDRFSKLASLGVFGSMAKEELHVVGEELLGYKDREGVDTADKMASWLDQQPPLVVATTCIIPPNIEELVQRSIANTPVKIDEWMTKDLVDELKLVRPDTLDIKSDGNRDVNALEAKCESFFHLNRHFCNAHQLEAALHVFSNLWALLLHAMGWDYSVTMHLPSKRKSWW